MSKIASKGGINTIEACEIEIKWWDGLRQEYLARNMFAAMASCEEEIKSLRARISQLRGFDDV